MQYALLLGKAEYMLNNAIEERVREIILERVPKSRKEGLVNSTQLLTSGLLDSLGILDIVTILEQKFDLTVNDEELVPEHFESIESISAFIKKKSSAIESTPGKDL
jgi:acyl carrier protein